MQLKLVIEMTDQDQLLVTGPIDNAMVCYGLLDLAKDVVRARAVENQKRVVKPVLPPGPALRGR